MEAGLHAQLVNRCCLTCPKPFGTEALHDGMSHIAASVDCTGMLYQPSVLMLTVTELLHEQHYAYVWADCKQLQARHASPH